MYGEAPLHWSITGMNEHRITKNNIKSIKDNFNRNQCIYWEIDKG